MIFIMHVVAVEDTKKKIDAIRKLYTRAKAPPKSGKAQNKSTSEKYECARQKLSFLDRYSAKRPGICNIELPAQVPFLLLIILWSNDNNMLNYAPKTTKRFKIIANAITINLPKGNLECINALITTTKPKSCDVAMIQNLQVNWNNYTTVVA